MKTVSLLGSLAMPVVKRSLCWLILHSFYYALWFCCICTVTSIGYVVVMLLRITETTQISVHDTSVSTQIIYHIVGLHIYMYTVHTKGAVPYTSHIQTIPRSSSKSKYDVTATPTANTVAPAARARRAASNVAVLKKVIISCYNKISHIPFICWLSGHQWGRRRSRN